MASHHVLKLSLDYGPSRIEDFAQFLIDSGVNVIELTQDGVDAFLVFEATPKLAKYVNQVSKIYLDGLLKSNPDDEDTPQSRPRDYAEKRFRQWGINRRSAKDMKHAALLHIIGELGWYPAPKQAGRGSTHIKFLNDWLPGYAPNLVFKKAGHRPGHVSAYSDAFGFTRVDIERTFRKEVRMVLFLERAMVAFPEHAAHIQPGYDKLKADMLADPKLAAEYETARTPIDLKDIMGTPEELQAITEDLSDEPSCMNCGRVGHIYESCDLPYIYITGWSKDEDEDSDNWETKL